VRVLTNEILLNFSCWLKAFPQSFFDAKQQQHQQTAKCQGSHVKKVFGFAVLASLCFMLFVCGTFLNA